MHELLAAIIENPGDDEPRRVYADWLIERGDPRGEFINVQCELARLAEGDVRAKRLFAREQSLLRANKMKWTLGIRGVEFTRGFVEQIGFKVEQLPRFAPLIDVEPVHAIAVATKKREQIGELAKWQTFDRMRTVEIAIGTLRSTGLAKILEARPFPSLRALNLSGCGVGGRGAVALAKNAPPRLESIAISRDSIGAAGIGRLLELPLTSVETTFAGVEHDGARLLAAKGLSRLKICLEGSVGDVVASTLAESGTSTALRELHLLSVELTDEGVATLAASPHLANLEHLEINLAGNQFGPRGVRAILDSPHLRSLRVLDLGWNSNRRQRIVLDAEHVSALRARFGAGLRLQQPGEPPPSTFQRLLRRWFF